MFVTTKKATVLVTTLAAGPTRIKASVHLYA